MAPAKNTELKVKSILVTQPKPETDKSPYADLAKSIVSKLTSESLYMLKGLHRKIFVSSV